MAEGKVSVLGTIPRHRVPAFLGRADILLFPSHNEGFGFVLIEAMAAGCVPVASRLPGVTDFIVEHGQTGVLCPVGDARAFAAAIVGLHRDRDRLRVIGRAASQAARRRFNLERLANDYARVLDAVMGEPPAAPPPLPWSAFRVPPPYRRRWRDLVPRHVRLAARRLAGRAG
jgi:glycosyltransferase involved in cell wall biosynthesis